MRTVKDKISLSALEKMAKEKFGSLVKAVGKNMSCYHKKLARGDWKRLSFIERMANTGMELERAFYWKNKNRRYSEETFTRFLELLGLTIKEERGFSRLRELTRVREAILDYFYGDNQYSFSEDFWRKYFYHFNYAAQLGK